MICGRNASVTSSGARRSENKDRRAHSGGSVASKALAAAQYSG